MKLFLIKFGLFNEAEEIHSIMYESLKEDTSVLNKKIFKFLKENLLINSDYFDSLSLNSEDENEMG